MSDRMLLRRRTWRSVTVAGVAWVAAAGATATPEPGVIAVAAAIGALAAVALSLRVRHPAVIVAAVALACAAAAAGTVWSLAPAQRAIADLEVDGGRHLRVVATVTGHLNATPGGTTWFDATVSSVQAGATTVRGTIPAHIGLDADGAREASTIGPGSRITVSGTALPHVDTDRAVLTLRGSEIESASAPEGLWAVFEEVRDALVASTRGLPPPGAGLIPGLAVGDTSGLDPGTEAAMNAASLSHLTAVSGANCALVVGATFGLLALCGAPRGLRVGGALVVLAAFVVLVTPEPSVVRAAAMSAIALVAMGLGRPAIGVAVLAAATTVLLITDPWLCRSLGFALSAAATAALLVLAPPLASGLSRWMPPPVALALAVPTSAQIACGPLIVLIDPHVPLLGVAANMLADPAAAPATILGALACVAPVPWLRDGLTALAWIPAQNLPWPDGPAGAALLALVGAAIALAIARPRKIPRLTALATAMVAVLVGVTGATSAVRTVAGPLTVPARWQIAMCDVGQGDATLWRSGSAVALVDTGPDPAPLDECLRTLGVSHLDLVVLTHFDKDHVGGTGAVIGRAAVVVHGPPAEAADQRLLDRLERDGASVQLATMGMSGSVGATRWQALGPLPGAEPGNDASVAIDVSGDGFPRTIMLGDLGAEPQAALLRRVDPPRVEVVKVSHHGSADQDPALYHRLHAALGLIGVGAHNTYGHPTERLLGILRETATEAARTDTGGLLAVWREDDGRLALWQQRGG